MLNLHPYIPYQRVDIDLTTGDYTTGEADGVMALYCNVGGTLAIQLVGEDTDVHTTKLRASTSCKLSTGGTDRLEATSAGIDCKEQPLFNAKRKVFSIATNSDHTIDYANGDFQVLPSGVLSADRNFTLPSGVADGLPLTVMSLDNTYSAFIVGATKPSGGADPALKYTTSTTHCITFRRVNSTWQAESSAQWTW